MLKIIYWLIAIVMFIAIMGLFSFCEEFEETIIESMIGCSGDSIKITKTGWSLIAHLICVMVCICWPITLILYVLMYFGFKRAE